MKSYITVSLVGSYIEEFMNKLMKENIMVWNVINKDGVIFFDLSPHYYKKTAEIALSHGMRTKVEYRRGSYFIVRRYKKRYGVFFGAVAFLGIIVLFSNFIWDVRVSGNQAVSNAQITEILEKHGIRSGVLISDFSSAKEKAELAIVLELDRLAWVNVERVGSRVNIKVSERLEAEADEIPITSPCNIVAGKSGQIVETEVYRGTLLIEKGSGINQGDIIVSGVVEDGTGNIILSHASAKIIAECEEEVEFVMPFTTLERKKTGKVTKKPFILFLGNTLPLFIKESTPENAVYSMETRAPTFLGFRLPYRLKTGIYTHYDIVEVQIGQNEAHRKLRKQIDTYRENFYSDSEIVSFDETFTLREDGIEAKVRIVYRTDIAKKKVIGVP